MIPFFFVPPVSMHAAYYVGGAIAFVELFALGVFLGRISRERLWLAGVKLVAAGVVALAISLLLNRGAGAMSAARARQAVRRAGRRRGPAAAARRSTRCSPASTSRSAKPSRTSRARC